MVRAKKYTNKNRTNKKLNNKKQNKVKTFKKANCAPSTEKKDYTCYSDSALIKMKNLWNARHPDSKILSTSTYEIWKQLKINMRLLRKKNLSD